MTKLSTETYLCLKKVLPYYAVVENTTEKRVKVYFADSPIDPFSHFVTCIWKPEYECEISKLGP